jgi:GNAT superfamily N-acetyltransferase
MTTKRPDRGNVQTVMLTDGRAASVRPMQRTDRSAVSSLYARTSAANLYTRFFTSGRGVIASHLDHLFDPLDPPQVYVAETAGRLIGVADVEPCDEITWEVAFLVADDAHGLGVATLLLERIADEARLAGVPWLVADVLAVNHPMMSVFTDAGFAIDLHTDHGEVAVRMSTASSPAVLAATAARHLSAERAGLASTL